MALTKEQEKRLLIALLAVLALAIAYRIATHEKPKTAPLAYQRGAVASSPVRGGVSGGTGGAESLALLIEKKHERYPGVTRDIFRMADFVPRPKEPPKPLPMPPPPPPAQITPTIPEKTPEEIAADLARTDLSKFRFLGYLTERDSSLFLSKDGELFIVKSGDNVLKSYKVKETGRDYVILLDTITRVEVRVELSGSEGQPPPHQRSR